MLLLGQGLPVFVQGVCFLGYVQFWSLPFAGLVWKYFPSLELLLQTVFVEFLQFLYPFTDIELLGRLRFDRLRFLRRLFLRDATWIGQVIKKIILLFLLPVGLQLHFLANYLLEIFVVLFIASTHLFYI